LEETINTNYFGPRRVNEAFMKILQTPKGRIVNVASASGPNYVNSLPSASPIKALLAQPWTIPGGIAEIDEMARNARTMLPKNEPYGASKALLNAYTVVHAKIETDLIIHSVTPGFIATDLTAGAGATNTPAKGAVPPCFLMMDETIIPTTPTGRYFGSDCLRSPIAFYRGPGEPPYESNDDLAPLPATATKMAHIL
jgi:carbonyl reductase 1